ncbi:unnamed protein product [Owenia fusiformis]|uniref:Uncharacterized protein n=1 Tax=Owenia fusiformis TaxID=6347 RepID=A0A8J1UKX7_OWEFU|nr:unnamed protein product [Owenia fusiformis]
MVGVFYSSSWLLNVIFQISGSHTRTTSTDHVLFQSSMWTENRWNMYMCACNTCSDCYHCHPDDALGYPDFDLRYPDAGLSCPDVNSNCPNEKQRSSHQHIFSEFKNKNSDGDKLCELS